MGNHTTPSGPAAGTHETLRIIVITGPKHTGKTLAGRALAEIAGGRFADLDEWAEKETGESSRALYKRGPEIFRKAEAEALARVFAENTGEKTEGRLLVIAAGGGLIDNREGMRLLQAANGLENAEDPGSNPALVYLNVKAETAWRRIRGAQNGELPPFLAGKNPEAAHRELHERRAAAYQALAHLVVNGETKSPEEIAREIIVSLGLR
jgi:shikimate kinase